MKYETLIKDLPDEEKPYEKCMCKGAAALTDRELLAILLRCGAKGQSALSLADTLLSAKEGYQGLECLCHYEGAELMRVPGIGMKKAMTILAALEITKRMSQLQCRLGRLSFCDPPAIVRHYGFELSGLEQERVICLFLDTKNHLICDKIISIGSVNFSLIPPREIFVMAFKVAAVHMILLHNHPSGDVSPSREDKEVTARIARLGRELGIALQDHIIIGAGGYFSFAEQGLLS